MNVPRQNLLDLDRQGLADYFTALGEQPFRAAQVLQWMHHYGVDGFDAMTWYGFLAPAKTPRAVVIKLQQDIAAIVHSPEVRQNFISQGNEPLANTPDEFAKVIRDDANKWGAIGKRLGVKLD